MEFDDLNLDSIEIPSSPRAENMNPQQPQNPQYAPQPVPQQQPQQQPQVQFNPPPAPQPAQYYPQHQPQPQPQYHPQQYQPQQQPQMVPVPANNASGMVRGIVLATLTIAVAYLVWQTISGGLAGPEPNDPTPAVVVDEAAQDAGSLYAMTQLGGMADLYATAAEQIEKGEIKDIKDLETFTIAGKKTVADKATEELAKQLERINGENWNTGNPKELAQGVSDGFKEVYEAAKRGMQ